MFSRGFLSAGTERLPHPKLNLVLRQIGSSSQVGENNISNFTPPHRLIADYCKYRVISFFFFGFPWHGSYKTQANGWMMIKNLTEFLRFGCSMLGKRIRTYCPKYWFDGDLPWYNPSLHIWELDFNDLPTVKPRFSSACPKKSLE